MITFTTIAPQPKRLRSRVETDKLWLVMASMIVPVITITLFAVGSLLR